MALHGQAKGPSQLPRGRQQTGVLLQKSAAQVRGFLTRARLFPVTLDSRCYAEWRPFRCISSRPLSVFRSSSQ